MAEELDVVGLILSVANAIVPLFLIVAFGFATVKLGYLNRSHMMGLNTFLMRVSMPIMFFNAYYEQTISIDELKFCAVETLSALFFLVLLGAFTPLYNLIWKKHCSGKPSKCIFPCCCGHRCCGTPGKKCQVERPVYKSLPETVSDWMISSYANTIFVGQPLLRCLMGDAAADRLPFLGDIFYTTVIIPMFCVFLEYSKIKKARQNQRNQESQLGDGDDKMDKEEDGVLKESPNKEADLLSNDGMDGVGSTNTNNGGSKSTKQQSCCVKCRSSLGLKIFLNIISIPIMHGLLLGFIVSFIPMKVPDVFRNFVKWVTASSTPIGIFNLGMFIALQTQKMKVLRSLYHVFLRMVLGPIMAILISKMLGMNDYYCRGAVIVLSTNTSASSFAFLTDYNVFPEKAPPAIMMGMLFLIPQQIVVQILNSVLFPNIEAGP